MYAPFRISSAPTKKPFTMSKIEERFENASQPLNMESQIFLSEVIFPWAKMDPSAITISVERVDQDQIFFHAHVQYEIIESRRYKLAISPPEFQEIFILNKFDYFSKKRSDQFLGSFSDPNGDGNVSLTIFLNTDPPSKVSFKMISKKRALF